MKIIINEINEIQEESITFKVKEVNDIVKRAVNYLEKFNSYIVGKQNERLYKVASTDIFYIETIDKKSFLYTEKDVISLSEKLYQLEEKLSYADFLRVSKSMILNIDKIDTVYPVISGRLEAKLTNGEVVSISRSYVADLKKKLGIGGK